MKKEISPAAAILLILVAVAFIGGLWMYVFNRPGLNSEQLQTMQDAIRTKQAEAKKGDRKQGM